MNEQESKIDGSEPDGWSECWGRVRPSADVGLRSRVLAAVAQEFADQSSRTVVAPSRASQRTSASWSWLGLVAALLVIWVHASWGASLAAPTPHLTSTTTSWEAHCAKLIEESHP